MKNNIHFWSDKNNGYFTWRPTYIFDLTKITGTLHEDQYTILIVSRLFHLRMINISDKSCRETQNTHLTFSNFFFENRTFYEITWKYFRACEATRQWGARALHAGYLRLQTHAHSFFTANNGYANAPQCYIIRTLPVSFESTTEGHIHTETMEILQACLVP